MKVVHVLTQSQLVGSLAAMVLLAMTALVLSYQPMAGTALAGGCEVSVEEQMDGYCCFCTGDDTHTCEKTDILGAHTECDGAHLCEGACAVEN